jgi:hypothetical protein
MTPLFYIEYVNNALGIWVKDWFLTRAEADASHASMIVAGYISVDIDNLSGSEWELSPVGSVEIELTPEGVLNFANEYALSDDPMG